MLQAFIEQFWMGLIAKPDTKSFTFSSCLQNVDAFSAFCMRCSQDNVCSFTGGVSGEIAHYDKNGRYTITSETPAALLVVMTCSGTNFKNCPLDINNMRGMGFAPDTSRYLHLNRFTTDKYDITTAEHRSWHDGSFIKQEEQHAHIARSDRKTFSAINLKDMLSCLHTYKDKQGKPIISKEEISELIKKYKKVHPAYQHKQKIKNLTKHSINCFIHYFMMGLIVEISNYFINNKRHPDLSYYTNTIQIFKFLIKLYLQYDLISLFENLNGILLKSSVTIGSFLVMQFGKFGFKFDFLNNSVFSPIQMIMNIFCLLIRGDYIAIIEKVGLPYAALFSAQTAAWLSHQIADLALSSLRKKYD